jgi:hypothetical protein
VWWNICNPSYPGDCSRKIKKFKASPGERRDPVSKTKGLVEWIEW